EPPHEVATSQSGHRLDYEQRPGNSASGSLTFSKPAQALSSFTT
ncbi:hypothetical protein AK812_SmicGene46887, partial [Symbiodinium microadriaticum]